MANCILISQKPHSRPMQINTRWYVDAPLELMGILIVRVRIYKEHAARLHLLHIYFKTAQKCMAFQQADHNH